MRDSTGLLDHGHDVCVAQAAENRAEGRSVSLLVLDSYSLASEYSRR